MLLPESNRWICLWKQRINGELPATLIETLRATDKDCFPNIHTLLMIGSVLPTSSATAERSFSLLRRLKTHLHSTMGDKRLSGLTLMSSHYSIPINIDAFANHFAQMHPRRMFMRIYGFNFFLQNLDPPQTKWLDPPLPVGLLTY